MMEEVSIVVAYDAHIINQMAEEDLLASLVADSRLKAVLPTQKQGEKIEKKRLSLDDPFLRYQKENVELQKTSVRLEQENDALAHELVTSKIALRTHLEQVEDKAEQLNKELMEARMRLVEAMEEKKMQEEEAAELKEMFRRQLEKAESEMKKSTAIMVQYKQICSQLSSRLENQQAVAKAELNLLKSRVMSCENCREVLNEAGLSQLPLANGDRQDSGRDEETDSLRSQRQEVELELAHVKVQLVEAESRIQELEHQKGALTHKFHNRRNSWFKKALGSLKTPTMQQ
ncbi:hypothetical protein MATL_G00239680 [Megalops atlanticus]|uniref:Rab GTPase-activating protein 1-like n=1 Tax=Megalops atlanticus TaxID=7932 RepID=A0A9D3PC12_MEGAT|nr:hypothetical protein MATL_G00239680 [Megalops atlanticus]